MKSSGLCACEPRGRHVEAGELAALDPLEEADPAVDLAFVEAVRPAEILQPLGLPVHLGQQRDALGQLVTQPWPGVEVAVERFGPLAVLSIGDQPSTKPIR